VFGKFYPHTLNYYQPHMVKDTTRKTAIGQGLLCTLAAQSILDTFLCARSSVEVMQCPPKRVALLRYFATARAINLTGGALV
jgi:hypothetical protein